MEKTIYNVFIPMENQEQCDRMKQLCIDNGLNISDYKDSFIYNIKKNWIYFRSSTFSLKFFISGFDYGTKTTEKEFIELLKTTK